MHEIGIENFPERAAVRVRPEFLAFLKMKARTLFGSLAKFSQQMSSPELAGTTIYSSLKKIHQKQLFPLPVLLRCCRTCDIPCNILQQNIIQYGLRRSHLLVTKPTLPILLTPVFDMLYAHHIADGFVVDPKRNRLPYFGYRQFNTFYRLLYFEKIQDVFGQINLNYDNALATTEVYCPPSASHFFFKAYGVGPRDFLSETSLLPQTILKKPKEHLLAVLIAFLIDEGHIDGSCAVITLKNHILIGQLEHICQRLGYATTTKHHTNKYAAIYLLARGLRKFWNDYCETIKQYPVMDLGWKGERILSVIEGAQRKFNRVPGNKQQILQLLKKRPATINEMALHLRMTRQGVRYLVKRLVQERNVVKKWIAKYGADTFALNDKN